MKALIAFLFVVLVLNGCVQQETTPEVQTPAVQTPVAEIQENSITIRNFAFEPATLTVKAGTTVTWTNEDSVSHQVHSEGVFDSPALSKGESWEYTFSESGTYDYICSIHPSMKGTIIVE